jgi:hypothetical protein
MGTPAVFDQILHSAMNAHAAWLPITNTFELGDYGLISNGVLVKMGNISDFGVTFARGIGPNSELKFTSQGTRIAKVMGNAEVDTFSDDNIAAKITLEFANESAFFIRANLTVVQMQNINQVARKLIDAIEQGWRSKFRVVSAIYTGQHCTIISSSAAQSKIELNGTAKVLKEFDLGNVAAGITASSHEDIGIQLIGHSGVIGLSMFKLPWLLGSDPKVLSGTQTVAIETDWPTELPDDV